MKPRLVLVEWRDTEHEATGWQGPDAIGTPPLRYRTVGWMVRRSRHFIVLSPTQCSGGTYSSIWTIPRGAVRRIRDL